MQFDSRMTVTARVDVTDLFPALIMTHADDRHAVRLTTELDGNHLVVVGTTDQFAHFIDQLADVVRDLTAVELVEARCGVRP